MEQGQDFAYFCRFTDDSRQNGQEFLFETDEKPLFYNENIRNTFNERIPELADSATPEGIIPVFVSYNFIRDVFSLDLRNDSGWPTVGIINPSLTSRGTVFRSTPAARTLDGAGATISLEERTRLEDNISEVIERIREGELLQTVISHRFDVEEFEATSLLSYMVENDRSRYVYYYRMGDLEMIGSSPESVYVRTGNTVTIHPIAGTRKRYSYSDSQLITSLKNDSKELCEHRMLVDLARNDLSRISVPGSVNVQANMVPEKFYSVIHLTSTVNGTLRPDTNQYDVLSSVFPAGTVSGAPKRRALEIIDHYERHDRGIYGGSVGLVGRNSADMSLPIRTVFRRGGESYVQAGAGIVKDSVPESEVDEMIAKANTIMAGGLVCE